MWLRFKLAFRNTFRNKRRTLLNVLMIAGGVSSMIIFEGFAHRIVTGLRETTIKTQTGHLQIASKKYWRKTSKGPKDVLLPHYKAWIKEIRKNPHVTYAVGRLNFYCLISKGELSLSAQGVSFAPREEARRSRAYQFIQGKGLTPEKRFQVAVGSGLAKKLNLKTGDRVTLMGQTVDGVVNALDMEVSGIFRTAIAEFDDSSFLIPLSSAQALLDTKGVEQIVVGLDSTSSTIPVRSELERTLNTRQSGIQIKPWYWLATLYRQVTNFNRIQNSVFKVIIVALILLSIMNTIGNSIAERTGEIGTVRAMGETPSSLVFQFMLEGVILGVLGALAGVVLSYVMILIINALKIPILFPGATAYFVIQIDLLFSAIKETTVLAIIPAMFAAILPALRASRMNIVEALRRFI